MQSQPHLSEAGMGIAWHLDPRPGMALPLPARCAHPSPGSGEKLPSQAPLAQDARTSLND